MCPKVFVRKHRVALKQDLDSGPQDPLLWPEALSLAEKASECSFCSCASLHIIYLESRDVKNTHRWCVWGLAVPTFKLVGNRTLSVNSMIWIRSEK